MKTFGRTAVIATASLVMSWHGRVPGDWSEERRAVSERASGPLIYIIFGAASRAAARHATTSAETPWRDGRGSVSPTTTGWPQREITTVVPWPTRRLSSHNALAAAQPSHDFLPVDANTVRRWSPPSEPTDGGYCVDRRTDARPVSFVPQLRDSQRLRSSRRKKQTRPSKTSWQTLLRRVVSNAWRAPLQVTSL